MRRICLLLLTLLALAPAVPAAAQVEGAYTLTQLEGRVLPAPSPDEDNVTVHAAALLLGEDGGYTFALQTSMGDHVRIEHRQATGTYRVEGDTLFLEMDDGSEPVPLVYALEEDGRLTLRVPAGYAYTFQRQ
jgi:hypothetical protein